MGVTRPNDDVLQQIRYHQHWGKHCQLIMAFPILIKGYLKHDLVLVYVFKK